MFLAASLLILLLALSITGSPIEIRSSPWAITLPLTRRLNFCDGTVNLLQHDKARVAAFRDNTHGRRVYSIPAPCTFWHYVVLGIGNPPTTYNLIIDTGSSNTWVGASTPYVETSTSINTTRLVEELSTSIPSLPDTLIITNFPIGIASTSSGISADGILGIGPEDLTLGALTSDIGQNIVGVFFQPIASTSDSGEITFGEPDSIKYTGNIAYTPITATAPAMNYWDIDQCITYGTTTILNSTAGIVDTGSAFISIASDAYARYQAVTGATVDQATGLLSISSDQYSALQNLDFHITGGDMFSLTPNAQIWPRSLNTKLDGPGVDNAIYLIVTNIGSPTGEGLDFINGYTFIQRFYTVFDGSKSCVGFATLNSLMPPPINMELPKYTKDRVSNAKQHMDLYGLFSNRLWRSYALVELV
ncbi:aspartic peptidase domain-containing protein [Suillus spraguei]|nr:aspartic peptidase domain-containing protein [Suillus spraguei]